MLIKDRFCLVTIDNIQEKKIVEPLLKSTLAANFFFVKEQTMLHVTDMSLTVLYSP